MLHLESCSLFLKLHCATISTKSVVQKLYKSKFPSLKSVRVIPGILKNTFIHSKYLLHGLILIRLKVPPFLRKLAGHLVAIDDSQASWIAQSDRVRCLTDVKNRFRHISVKSCAVIAYFNYSILRCLFVMCRASNLLFHLADELWLRCFYTVALFTVGIALIKMLSKSLGYWQLKNCNISQNFWQGHIFQTSAFWSTTLHWCFSYLNR